MAFWNVTVVRDVERDDLTPPSRTPGRPRNAHPSAGPDQVDCRISISMRLPTVREMYCRLFHSAHDANRT